MHKTKIRLNRLFNYIVGEKFYKKISFVWNDKPSRLEIIKKIINLNNYKEYLEIGCDNDQVFSNIDLESKLGIDPISGGNIRKTSDEFFLSNTKKFDIIFIDGLHTYEQVKKDIKNSLNFLNPKGVIILHDCLPASYIQQAIPRSQYKWTGDVWKAIVEVRTKKYLDTYTCYADMGLGIIFNRPNSNILNIKKKNFKELSFKEFFYNHKNLMNIISHEEIEKLFEL